VQLLEPLPLLFLELALPLLGEAFFLSNSSFAKYSSS